MFMRGQFMTKEASRELFSHGWKWSITEKNREALMKRIAPYVIYKKKEECLDLPEKIDLKRYVEFTQEENKLYKEMKRDLIVELKDQVITAQLVLTKIMKLRQLTGGFILDAQGVAHKTSTAKINELKDVLHEMGTEQCIVWGHFVYEIKRIAEELESAGYAVSTYYSGTQDREKSYTDFKSGKTQVLVANPQSCAHGLTLTNCNQQVWYSMSYSYEQYTQGRQRVHRIGQTRACTYTHLIIRGSIDEVIYDALRNKKNINEVAMSLLK
jgi:SNF2 family DNA or RNA helicase